jgi:UDPglucose 6-dehydrogenase
MKIAIIGAGYVGLTTGACLAELGHSVVCVDVDADRVRSLQRGNVPIFEPGLAELTQTHLKSNRLRFTTDAVASVRHAQIVFLAVGTPPDELGDIDLSYIEAAARGIARALRPDALVVVKSTVTAGTARWLKTVIAEERGDDDIAVAANPEFLREGSAIDDFMNADRIIVGADEPRAGEVLARLYEPLNDLGIPLVLTSTANAELIKYTSNAFLALKIGFINEVADLCEKIGGDITAVAEGIGLDRRIGKSFLAPGPGFGGSCFPKDTRAFASTGRKYGAPQALIETLIEKNEDRKKQLAGRIVKEARSGRGRVAILGTAFKANTDDVREAASLTIIPILQDAGLQVRAHDPKAQAGTRRALSKVHWFDRPYEAATGADLVVILTEWDEYRTLDLSRLAGVMAGRTLIDYRNILDPREVTRHGLRYVSLGRPPISFFIDRHGHAQPAGARIGMAASPA